MKFTGGRSFFDTNVLVYTDDRDTPEKQATALDLLAAARRDGKGVVSTQVLQEYFVAATGKLGVEARLARRKVELFARLDVQIVDLEDIVAATDLRIVHQISFWDGLVIAAARRAGCRRLFTEDLGSGSTLAGIEIVNPFA